MERLDHFMARANALYYANHDPFRDFTTAPEITQVFGELLGAWAATVWNAAGRPTPVLLAEAGPGRGTLMADALRASAQIAPAFHAALDLHLIETSPRLRALQAERLPPASWHDSLVSLPRRPLILLANEFLDALPVRHWVRRDGRWFERHVDTGAFVDCPAPEPPAAHGDLLERSDAAHAFVAALARRIADGGCAALLIDYGPTESAGGHSLQAIRDGVPADPLAAPGTADLTAHVDFAGLAETARRAGAAVHGPIPQGPFLAALGLFQRTGQLARTQPPARAAALVAAAQRLAEPAAMGRLFKAMAICHPSLPTPPGFPAMATR